MNESDVVNRNPSGTSRDRAAVVLDIGAVRTAPPRSPSPTSGFHISLIPNDRIFKRSLMPWSVHHSGVTKKWIATITRPDSNNADNIRRIQFPFRSEREARKFCKAYAPPRIMSGTVCQLCLKAPKKNALIRNCRNCGVCVCDACSTRWGSSMVPKTYANRTAQTLRVCTSCDWLSNAFCMALLQGRHQDVLRLYETVGTL